MWIVTSFTHILAFWGYGILAEPPVPPEVPSTQLQKAMENTQRNQAIHFALAGCLDIFLQRRFAHFESVATSLSKLAMGVLIAEVVYFTLHWICHKVPELRQYHEHHHNAWHTTVFPFATLDCSQFEHAFLNMLPLTIAASLTKMDDLTLNIFVFLATIYAMAFAHAMPTTSYRSWHSVHHKNVSVNFGAFLMIPDRLLGTFQAL